MANRPGADEYQPLSERDPWEDSDWMPSDAVVLLPKDALSELLLETPVSDIAIADPAAISPDATMAQAIFRMRQRHVRALLVMEAGRLLGILTDRDAVRAVDPADTGDNIRVRDVMTPDPLTVHCDDPIGKAAQTFCVDGFHHLPVVDADGKVEGIVAEGPVLHAIISLLLDEQATPGDR
ncbi:MAG: CBS domain-containing protein [Dehalococcoidia bacterium]